MSAVLRGFAFVLFLFSQPSASCRFDLLSSGLRKSTRLTAVEVATETKTLKTQEFMAVTRKYPAFVVVASTQFISSV